MHQAGVANTKWAIEYWKPAADAFKLNNPGAEVYNGNCNVLLHRAMSKAGALEQCDASESCAKESAELDAATVDTLPLPGQVDFICGGPPCQVWLQLVIKLSLLMLLIFLSSGQVSCVTAPKVHAGRCCCRATAA